MSYQFYNPAPVLFTLTGLVPAAGGSLTFYEVGTTTPKNTHSDPALSVLNSNPVLLDSAGRSATAIWLSGNYDVVLKAAGGATVWTRQVNAPTSAGATIPALVADQFLSNDGTNSIWQPVSQVPDASGSEGYTLGVAGGIATWLAPTVIAETTTVTGNNLTIGALGGKFSIQTGSRTGANAGGRTQTVSVTFATPFTATPFIGVQLANPSGLSTFTNQPSSRLSSKSTSGFTVVWVMGEIDDSQGGYDFNAAVVFDFVAMGLTA